MSKALIVGKQYWIAHIPNDIVGVYQGCHKRTEHVMGADAEYVHVFNRIHNGIDLYAVSKLPEFGRSICFDEVDIEYFKPVDKDE